MSQLTLKIKEIDSGRGDVDCRLSGGGGGEEEDEEYGEESGEEVVKGRGTRRGKSSKASTGQRLCAAWNRHDEDEREWSIWIVMMWMMRLLY